MGNLPCRRGRKVDADSSHDESLVQKKRSRLSEHTDVMHQQVAAASETANASQSKSPIPTGL